MPRRHQTHAVIAITLLLGAAGQPACVSEPDTAEPASDLSDGPSKNVLFILVDTFAVHYAGPWGGRISTPGFDAFVSESVFAPNASASGTWTVPATEALLTGRHPVDEGLAPSGALSFDGPNGLGLDMGRGAEALAEPEWGGGFLADSGLLLRGVFTNALWHQLFGGFTQTHTEEVLGDHGWATQNDSGSAAWVFGQCRAQLEANRADRPAGGWFQTCWLMDTHLEISPDPEDLAAVGGTDDLPPFPIPDATPERFVVNGPGVYGTGLVISDAMASLDDAGREVFTAWMRRYYEAELYGWMWRFDAFFAAARADGLLEDTAVVLVSDHGESTGEIRAIYDDALAERTLQRVWGHDASPYHTERRTAFVVWAEGLQPKVIPEVVSAIDVLPTIVQLLDLEPGAGWSDWWDRATGVPLGAGAPDRAVFSYPLADKGPSASVVLQRGQWTLIYEVNGKLELYDHEADPEERFDLRGSAEHAAVLEALWPVLWAEVERYTAVTDVGFPPLLPPGSEAPAAAQPLLPG